MRLCIAFGHGPALATGSRASDGDCNYPHVFLHRSGLFEISRLYDWQCCQGLRQKKTAWPCHFSQNAGETLQRLKSVGMSHRRLKVYRLTRTCTVAQ